MATAFIMISCDMGQERAVADELKTLGPIKQVEKTFGAYDIVAKIESNTSEKIKETILHKILKIDSVRTTMTLFVN